MSESIKHRLRLWRESPLLFVKECIEVTPSEQQVEALMKFPHTKKMSIRSGHGTGKDAFAAWIATWFLSTRAYAKVACTAPTARQLGDILWSEMSKWIRKSKVADEFVVQKDKIFHKSAPKEWWARAISPQVKATKEEQAETLAGLHADHLLIIVDEASGIPDPVFVPLEGALTQEDNRVLLIGNMTKNVGYFFDSHFSQTMSKYWTRLHWDSRKSSLVTKEMVQYFVEKYGEDSNVFRIRVAGEPPIDSESTLIPLSWSIQCVGNEIEVAEDEPLYIGADIGRQGDDSVFLPRRGLKILPWERWHEPNLINLAGYLMRFHYDVEAEGLAIDEIGIGAGVLDWLQKKNVPGVFGVNVAHQSSNPKQFYRLRDELWLAVRDKCMRGVYSFPDIVVKRGGGVDINIGHELANELSSPTYDLSKGFWKVESKLEMKSRGLASPNIADALCLTEYFHSIAHRVWRKGKPRKADRPLRPWEKQGRKFFSAGRANDMWKAA